MGKSKVKKKEQLLFALISVAVVALAVALMAMVLWQPEGTPPEPTSESTRPPESTVAQSPFSPGDFIEENGFLTCAGAETMVGIDVSRYQGDVDWHQAKAAGVEFVMVRLGYRGIDSELLNEDPYARANLTGAREAGLLVGAYFYSQATTETEAREEAAFALEILGDFELDLPLSFDWEIESRTKNVDVDTATDCTIAFCDAVERSGREAMIYFNTNQARERLDLTRLGDYPWWLAKYDRETPFPCQFDIWQYTQTGKVPGIHGDVDINVMIIGGEMS